MSETEPYTFEFCVNFCTSVIYNVIIKKIVYVCYSYIITEKKNHVLTCIQFKIILYFKKKLY